MGQSEQSSIPESNLRRGRGNKHPDRQVSGPPHLAAFRFEELVSRAGSPKPDGIPEASYITASKTPVSRQNPRASLRKTVLFTVDFPAVLLFPNGAYGADGICSRTGAHFRKCVFEYLRERARKLANAAIGYDFLQRKSGTSRKRTRMPPAATLESNRSALVLTVALMYPRGYVRSDRKRWKSRKPEAEQGVAKATHIVKGQKFPAGSQFIWGSANRSFHSS